LDGTRAPFGSLRLCPGYQALISNKSISLDKALVSLIYKTRSQFLRLLVFLLILESRNRGLFSVSDI
jgi:hypothetical protein